jgi:transcriptional regulator with XRE-family HTH domain
MKANGKSEEAMGRGISDDLRQYLEGIPPVTKADLGELRAAGEELAANPGFQAESLKSLFIEKVLLAMEEKGISKSELAKRWKKSRQYISKLLHEDRSVNFTIETMAELAHQLGLRIEIQMREARETARPIKSQLRKCEPTAASSQRRSSRTNGRGMARITAPSRAPSGAGRKVAAARK